MKIILATLALCITVRADITDADIDAIPKSDIIATVKHLQRLAKEGQEKAAQAEAKTDAVGMQLDSAQYALARAGDETEKVQGIVNTRTQERDAARASEKKQAHAKWFWFFSTLACVAWITRGFWGKLL